jgi:hypothetical protein
MVDLRGYENVTFVAGKNFQSEYGTHEAGSVVEEAHEFQNLQVLIDSGFVYPYAPAEGYGWLPPHIFSSVALQEEVMAKIEGQQFLGREQYPNGKPNEVLQAEAEADAQQEVYRKLRGDDKREQEESQEAASELADELGHMGTQDADNPAAADTPEDLEEMREDDGDYNPDDHTVPEVNEWLESHPNERDRVLKAEKDGQARKGILGDDA